METGGLHGRGRKYDLILVDEAAFIRSDMDHLWSTSIKPTLATMPNHRVYVFSTPAPNSDISNWFYALHFGKGYQFESNDSGFKQFYRPSHTNPLVDKAFLLDEQRRTHPLSFRQEYLAEWGRLSLAQRCSPSLNHAIRQIGLIRYLLRARQCG